MPTRGSAVRVRDLGILVLLLLGVAGVAAAAEVRVTPNTEVRSIGFEGARSLSPRTLNSVLETRGRGSFHGLRTALAKLPFIGPPRPHPFSPRTLQEDVVRLRNRYSASGFRGTSVRYRVEHDEDEDLLDIVFVIEEGVPQTVVAATIVPGDSLGVLPVPPEERKSWGKIERDVASLIGGRPEIEELLDHREQIQSWWRNRGFPRAEVDAFVDRDSVRNEVKVLFPVKAGDRKRFGSIHVEGNDRVSDRTLLRELPFEPGDFYSRDKMAEGRRNLQLLQIIRAARVETPSAVTDSPTVVRTPAPAVPVTVTVTEAKPRVVGGQIGYGLDTGASTEADWSHRNFAGGARVFTVSAYAQTGRFAVSRDADIRYRGSVSLLQPHFLRPRLNAVVSPFVEFREDTQDRSLQVGSNFTLVYEFAKQFSLSLDYQIASRRVYEYRLGEFGAGNVDLLTLLTRAYEGQLDSLGTRLGTSLFTLSGLAGSLNDLSNPRSGLLVRPTLQVTAPTAWSEVSYWKADGSVYGFLPLGPRATVAARVSAGRLFPFGDSVPGEDGDATGEILLLRDANFTAGGSNDVRGWSNRKLGPKFPDARFRQVGDSLAVVADGYVPLGGFNRVSFSLELRLPMPFLGPRFGSHLFLDGGRVWTDDGRFGDVKDALDQDRFFYATGAGIDIFTPVGAVKLDLGYKLNPSITDLADASDVLQALLEDAPVEDLEKHNLRRFQLNLSLGVSY